MIIMQYNYYTLFTVIVDTVVKKGGGCVEFGIVGRVGDMRRKGLGDR